MMGNPQLRKSSDYLNTQIKKAEEIRNEVLEAKGIRNQIRCNLKHTGCKVQYCLLYF